MASWRGFSTPRRTPYCNEILVQWDKIQLETRAYAPPAARPRRPGPDLPYGFGRGHCRGRVCLGALVRITRSLLAPAIMRWSTEPLPRISQVMSWWAMRRPMLQAGHGKGPGSVTGVTRTSTTSRSPTRATTSVFPTYTRTYILPREGYEPFDLLTPDPFDPFAYLIGEQVVARDGAARIKDGFSESRPHLHDPPRTGLLRDRVPLRRRFEMPQDHDQAEARPSGFPAADRHPLSGAQLRDAILIAQSIQQTEQGAVDLVHSIYDAFPSHPSPRPGWRMTTEGRRNTAIRSAT